LFRSASLVSGRFASVAESSFHSPDITRDERELISALAPGKCARQDRRKRGTRRFKLPGCRQTLVKCDPVCANTIRRRKLQGLFVTVDPERDTPRSSSNTLPAFHPAFLGLAG